LIRAGVYTHTHTYNSQQIKKKINRRIKVCNTVTIFFQKIIITNIKNLL
jgi:hypothetical protein